MINSFRYESERVITWYNLEKYITRAPQLYNQSLPEQFYEIIVVDDCSTDNSWERINEFDFITTIKHDENKVYQHRIPALEHLLAIISLELMAIL